ncbi:ATP synthase F0 subunit 8 (mitochondrion) [Frieseomelitta varia]|uniref:ATP synthase F0 subunit 8 n=1 Tax=Frieseomelitta varia TaxID=561572 RepID=A0A833RLP1_9HYME|nr:ATP synthase F0 subunit 8 [Frieseomelitta varia]
MPQMMPIYWLMIFYLCLFVLMLIMINLNSYFMINMMNFSFNKNIMCKKYNKFIFKWN